MVIRRGVEVAQGWRVLVTEGYHGGQGLLRFGSIRMKEAISFYLGEELFA